MKNIIYCKPTAKGILSFYLKNKNKNDNDYFLFNQNYRKGVYHFYKNGVSVDDASDFSKVKTHNAAVYKTMEKLPIFLRYAEKEYGFVILDQTKRKLTPIKMRSQAYPEDELAM